MAGFRAVYDYRQPAHTGADFDPHFNPHVNNHAWAVAHPDGFAHAPAQQHAHHHPYAQAVSDSDSYIHTGAHLDGVSDQAYQYPRAIANRNPVSFTWKNSQDNSVESSPADD